MQTPFLEGSKFRTKSHILLLKIRGFYWDLAYYRKDQLWVEELASQTVEEFLPEDVHFAAPQPLFCTQKAKSSSKCCSVPVSSPFLRKDWRLSALVHVGRDSTVTTAGSGCWISVKLQILETFNGFCIHIVLNICTSLFHELTFRFGKFL